ncbi:phosphate ABC transporter permease PstA [Mycoplasma putrefaciens]|uniref:Phosphate transport system permease protein PstA n=1 Tax=Mycoplasma putrefaciens (strain ATCC 15718 / NCTC 10155 / C30 KS-1 / KS-1) TaxID=743965 RepID=A0A7U3ZSC0_MYCPK|nr:phosphate ABC transporter permease PstA [Mycoplasma putrefaciens]AEM68631.1 phosphate ABC transporter, permease protein PstA [Mycoplasma putrefaciens KS1]
MLLNQKVKNNTNFKSPKQRSGFVFNLLRSLIWFFSLSSIAILILLIVFVGIKTSTIFNKQSFWSFIFGKTWNPEANQFGIGIIILMTLVLMLFSMLFAVPLTLFTTLFISEYLSKKAQRRTMTIIKLLAGIPSVVFGLFAREQIGNLFRLMGAYTNDNLMVAAITMAFMAIPIMVSLSYDAIQQVPIGYRDSSLALGISKEKTTFSIVRKSATPKIISAVILGMARVIGETMAIMMVAGNATAWFNTNNGAAGFLFSSLRTLSSTIGLEILENSGAAHESALYAIGLFLFLLVFVINLAILLVSNKEKISSKIRILIHSKSSKSSKAQYLKLYDANDLDFMIKNRAQNQLFKNLYSKTMLVLMWLSTSFVIGFTFWIIITTTTHGLIATQYSHAFLSIEGQAGIFAAMLTTLLLILCTLGIAIPFALATAIYLAEFAKPKSLFAKVFRFLLNITASTPSIIFGIFGLSVFINYLKIPFSVIAAALTMTIVILPMLIKNFEDAITGVPKTYREAAAALGLSRTKRLFKIVLPNAMQAIITGIILAMARIIGESAPIYLTLGTAIRMPLEGFMSSGATLTTGIYILASEAGPGVGQAIAWLMSFVTIVFVLTLNFTSGRISGLLVRANQTTNHKLKEVFSNLFKAETYKNWIINISKNFTLIIQKVYHVILKTFNLKALINRINLTIKNKKAYQLVKKRGKK